MDLLPNKVKDNSKFNDAICILIISGKVQDQNITAVISQYRQIQIAKNINACFIFYQVFN